MKTQVPDRGKGNYGTRKENVGMRERKYGHSKQNNGETKQNEGQKKLNDWKTRQTNEERKNSYKKIKAHSNIFSVLKIEQLGIWNGKDCENEKDEAKAENQGKEQFLLKKRTFKEKEI